MKYFLIVLLLCCPAMANEGYRDLFNAIRHVETGGEPHGGRDAVGDNGASIGPYQIQRAYWIDSKVPGEYEQVRDRAYAERVMIAYWKRYAREALNNRDYETLSRIHNGGPSGPRRASTVPYWNKVKRILEKQ